MFKGLRTKIESEQRGQTSKGNSINNNNINSNTKQSTTLARSLLDRHSQTGDRVPSKDEITAPTNPNQSSTSKSIPGLSSRELVDRVSTPHQDLIISSDNQGEKYLKPSGPDHGTDDPSQRSKEEPNLDHLEGQISKLKDQLNSVIREREESNDQNAQLYQLIEKLRRNLETESETKSGLQARLADLEKQLNEKSQVGGKPARGNIAFNKSFNPDVATSEPNIPNDVEALRNEVIELQAQLAKKNRQLKIRQQNLTDIKRTLQKEILDHSKAQEELSKLYKQMQSSDQQATQAQLNHSKNKNAAPIQNGSNHAESSDNLPKPTNHLASGDKDQEHAVSAGSQISGNISSVGDDTISLNAALGLGGNVQLDGISCLSRSSASVDDFDSNDLHQTNYNKEVSHEYLRNVLYRYMTSTDNETTQHLVKAISVLMDFSPEQYAAIKSAMTRKSSWLRLK